MPLITARIENVVCSQKNMRNEGELDIIKSGSLPTSEEGDVLTNFLFDFAMDFSEKKYKQLKQ